MATVRGFNLPSDGLAGMIAAIEPSRKTGLVLSRRSVEDLLEGLLALRDAVRHVEILAERAQERNRPFLGSGRVSRESLEAAIADGTVTLFPVAARPVPGRSPDQDGAA